MREEGRFQILPFFISRRSTRSTTLLALVPCYREGTGWLEEMLIKMEKGEADTREIPMLEEITRAIEGHTICALGDAAAWPVQVGNVLIGFCGVYLRSFFVFHFYLINSLGVTIKKAELHRTFRWSSA